VTTKLDEMWAAFEAHEPAPEYAEAWQRMLMENTAKSAQRARRAVPVGLPARDAAGAAAWALDAAEAVDKQAQRAIDAIKEVKP
jgi:hypothetical protein